MSRPPEHPVARPENDVGGRRALDDLRCEERVAAAGTQAAGSGNVGRQFCALSPGEADVEILRLEGCRIGGARRDAIAEAAREPDRLDPDAIAPETLLDTRVNRPRAL